MKTRKALAIFMAVAMVFCYMPSMAYADITAEASVTTIAVAEYVFEDMPEEGFWSTTALKAAVNNGLLNGFAENDGSYIKPNDPLTRAQMATIINRAFGAEEMASLSGANDVYATEWYFTEMQKAVKMGTMMLDTSMRPNDSITRQEAFTVLGRALKMQDGTAADFNTFGDADQVASWATSGMGAMVKAGYIKGDNNLLTPTASMTRAQFAVIMNNVIKEYITVSGTVTEVAAGNVMVNVDGVTLKNLTITGDLVVGDGVGDGTLTLDNVIIKGDLIARGGGVDSIVITGGSVNGKVIIAKVDGKIRVFAENGAEIDFVEIDDGTDDVIMEGTFGTIEVQVDTPVIMRNATVTKMDVNTVGAGNVSVESGSTVGTVNVGAASTGTKVNVAGTVTNFNTSAGNTGLSGTGTVTNANVKDGANGTKITTPKTVITNAGATGVTAGGGTAVGANTTATNNATGTGATVTTTATTGSTTTTTTTTASPTLSLTNLNSNGIAIPSSAGVYQIPIALLQGTSGTSIGVTMNSGDFQNQDYDIKVEVKRTAPGAEITKSASVSAIDGGLLNNITYTRTYSSLIDVINRYGIIASAISYSSSDSVDFTPFLSTQVGGSEFTVTYTYRKTGDLSWLTLDGGVFKFELI